VPKRITTAELLDDWLAVARRHLSPNTRAEYERVASKRLRPHIGDVKLTELRPAHIARMLEAATVSVRRTRTRVAYEMHEAARTKTRAGARVVDIDPATVAVI
jgi:hypothetical protein